MPELFKKTNVAEKDFINDNEEELENDVKNYSLLRRSAKEDIIKFDQPTIYNVDTQQLLAPIVELDKEEGKEGDKKKKPKKWLMPGTKTNLPTVSENPLKKSRGFSFE